jgi:hypothetical protein
MCTIQYNQSASDSKMAVFWVVEPCSQIEVYRRFSGTLRPDGEGSKYSETSGNFYQTTRHYNPEYSHFHTRRRENLKSS